LEEKRMHGQIPRSLGEKLNSPTNG
jgi:hypothetical protein